MTVIEYWREQTQDGTIILFCGTADGRVYRNAKLDIVPTGHPGRGWVLISRGIEEGK